MFSLLIFLICVGFVSITIINIILYMYYHYQGYCIYMHTEKVFIDALTLLTLASFLWNINKQCKIRSSVSLTV